MKTLLIAAAVAGLAATGAQAADIAARTYTKAPATVPYSNWTGFYAGVSGGYGGSDRDSVVSPNDASSIILFPAGGVGSTALGPSRLNASGGFGGLQAGYNWRFSRLVLGIETDINFADIKSNANTSNVVGGAVPSTLNSSESLKWFGTVRGRVGFVAANDFLLFATGGLAYGRVDQAATYTPFGTIGVGFTHPFQCSTPAVACFAGNNSKTDVGYTVGAGGEWMFWKNVSLKAEYSYINLGKTSYNINATEPFSPAAVSSMALATTLDYHVVRAGLNWHF
ncbi:MAG: outer membrane beta-barrel protein [Afipia sp.]|nr:outer membrane beta-barrel protein [Afipia sp.]